MSYDRKKNTADAINYAIKLNRLNDETSERASGSTVPLLAEDLSNLVDVGTAIANIDADQFKSFAKDIAMGLGRIEIIDRVYNADTFGIVKDSVEYNGALERICVKALAKLLPSNANNLVYGSSYLDGKYYGPELDALVWTDENANFKIPYSIGYEDIKAKFTQADWVTKTIDAWRNMVHTTMEVYLKGIADTLIEKMIAEAIDEGNEIKLVTEFCSYFGYVTTTEGVTTNNYTWADIKADVELMKQFVGFWALCLGLVRDGFTKFQSKYNDGTVPTFTPSDKIRLLGLTEFVNDMTYFGRANMFNGSVIPSDKISTTLSWSSDGSAKLPLIGNTGKFIDGTIVFNDNKKITGNATTSTTYENVVAVMYDEDMLGVTPTLNRIGVEEVGSELFTTYFHHYAVRQYIDKRGNAVVFTLE